MAASKKPNPAKSRDAEPKAPLRSAKPARTNGKAARKPQAAQQPRSLLQPAAAAAATPMQRGKIKNQAGLNSRELDHFRQLLLSKRRELLGDVRSMEDEALQSGPGVGNLSNLPDHMADQGTDNYEQEFTLGLMEKDRKVLREIDAALAKLGDGTYGICEGTGKPIGKPRLEAQPWARYSIEYARKLEKGAIRQ